MSVMQRNFYDLVPIPVTNIVNKGPNKRRIHKNDTVDESIKTN